MCPKPREWKSQLKKYIHHQRIYKELKIPYRLSESNNGNIVIIPEIKNVAVKKTEIIHISDAIGLALYAIKKNR